MKLRILVVAAVGAAATLVPAAPAHAVPPSPCTLNTRVTEVRSAEVNPVLTHFMAINIAPGTTGERTETLTVVNQVTVTVGSSTEISASGTLLLATVSAKVGFSVQVAAASTTTESTSMKWTFTEPGYYGLYKGTRRVAGMFQNWSCVRSPTGAGTIWIGVGAPIPFITFDHVEVGTIRCGDSTPPGTLREQARLQLGC